MKINTRLREKLLPRKQARARKWTWILLLTCAYAYRPETVWSQTDTNAFHITNALSELAVTNQLRAQTNIGGPFLPLNVFSAFITYTNAFGIQDTNQDLHFAISASNSALAYPTGEQGLYLFTGSGALYDPTGTNLLLYWSTNQVTAYAHVAFAGAISATNVGNVFNGNGGGLTNVAAANLSGVLPIGAGGTGQTTAASALSALGGASLTANNTLSGNNTFTGIVTENNALNSLAGNAQGGAVTNLDYATLNIGNGGPLANAFGVATNLGRIIYEPNSNITVSSPITFSSVGVSGGQNQAYGQTIKIRGNGTSLSEIRFTGSKTNLFDQYSAPFGAYGLDLSGLDLLDGIYSGGAGSMGYVSAPGAYGLLDWNDVCFNQWLLGACITQSGLTLNNIDLEYNSVGLTMAPYSDGGIVNVIRAFGNTNAAMENDSRGNRIFMMGAGNNIDVLVGGGGGLFIQDSSEAVTNCSIACGFPTNWIFSTVNPNPYNTQYAGTQMGNGDYIGNITAGFGYLQQQQVNWTNQLAYNNGAFVKIWNAPASLHIQSEDLVNCPAVISYAGKGDKTPIFVDSTTVGVTNLMVFSDGTSIPSQDGAQVSINEPWRWFTKNTLMMDYETNGTLSVKSATITNLTVAGTASWYRAGQQAVASLSTSQAVTFSSALASTNYAVSVTADGTLASAVGFGVTSKTATGFTLTLSSGVTGGVTVDYTATLNQ